jgi:hypothetical protein
LTLFSFQAFIPTLGRDGPQNNPEILVGVFSIFYGLLIGGFLVMYLKHLSRKQFPREHFYTFRFH